MVSLRLKEMNNDNIYPYYLLRDNEPYKILLLYILRTLSNDIKETIFDMLIYEEELTLEIQKLEKEIAEVRKSIQNYEIYLSHLSEPQYAIYINMLSDLDSN